MLRKRQISNHKLTGYEKNSKETWKKLFGPHYGFFCHIMDIYMGGYRKLEIDNDVLCVRLVFEEKKSFQKKLFH